MEKFMVPAALNFFEDTWPSTRRFSASASKWNTRWEVKSPSTPEADIFPLQSPVTLWLVNSAGLVLGFLASPPPPHPETALR
eukprot:CAMPEP_0175575344 /NCGR_PEP_ID=MMETSP0096-20121207/44517_1 /TAXON_ID=311494 /ORGANISM="Alexandrium monilatum, Strain CCMP3105" /LENGTH=81 /DNA_ID=CAMNT_0016878871 /DNA_START=171 /DNA_END=416 /DNA_ORIENTATION=+